MEKISILAVTKAFFMLLVMCCFSCSNGETNYETTSPVIEKTNNIIGVKIATIQVLENATRDVYVYVIDSCEYVGYIKAYRSDFLTHKGNCKYCAKRSLK